MIFIKNKKSTYFYILLLIAFFFSLNHYHGYDEDASLYLLQIVHYLHPDRFVNDIPYMFGNQDSFSLYSPVAAFFINSFSVSQGGKLLCFCLQFLWCIGCLGFIFNFAKNLNEKKHWFFVAVLCIMLFSLEINDYHHQLIAKSGELELFANEPFLVARLMAESLVLCGLTFFFYSNKYISLIFFFAGTLMHPLMAGWSLPLWLLFHFPYTAKYILVLSLVFPLTAYLNVGTLCVFPSDWMSRPLVITPSWQDILEYTALLFALLGICRNSANETVRKLSKVSFVLLLIGSYLQIVGSKIEYVFLYQVQPFRVEWLCIMLFVPLLIFFCIDIFLADRDRIRLSDLATIALGLLAISIHNIAPIQILLLLIALRIPLFERLFSSLYSSMRNFVLSKFLAFSLFVVLIITYAILNTYQIGLEGSIDLAETFSTLQNLVAFALPVNKIVLVIMMFFTFREKRVAPLLFFILGFCVDRITVAPSIGFILVLLPQLSQRLQQGLINVALGMTFVEVAGVGENEGVLSFLFLIFAVICCFGLATARRKMLALMALLLCTSIVACEKWDRRPKWMKLREQQMDSYLDQTIFPEIKDRGRILFLSNNSRLYSLRMQFLTGGYVEYGIEIGEIFNKDFYILANERKNRFLYGAESTRNISGQEFKETFGKLLAEKDILNKRIKYLCSNKEIHHVVSDITEINLPKKDSTDLDVLKSRFFLFQCD